jgi:ORF6N domain
MVFCGNVKRYLMPKATHSVAFSEEAIISKIYLIRGQKVMIDRDLAALYGVETRTLNQAIKRNKRRFPADFMFQLTPGELKNWMSQIVISNKERMGLRKLPIAFTENGVAMLSSVLNSETAIAVNIKIIRIFTRMRQVLLAHKDIMVKLEQLEKKLMKQDYRMKKSEEDIQVIFAALKQLLNPPQPARPRIGFRRPNEND